MIENGLDFKQMAQQFFVKSKSQNNNKIIGLKRKRTQISGGTSNETTNQNKKRRYG